MIGLMKLMIWGSLCIGAAWLTEHLESQSLMPFVFTFIGSPFVLFADVLSGSGFTFRLHFVNAATPEFLWRLVGVGCWITAGT